MLLVHPVDHVHRTVRAVVQIHAHEVRVSHIKLIRAGMNRVVAGTAAQIELPVHLAAMQVVREKLVAEL